MDSERRENSALALNTLHLGNCLEWLKTVPDGIADAVITDPPYSSGGQYRGDRMQDTNKKYQQTGFEHLYASFEGDNRDQRSFAYWCALWLSEAMRCTKPGGIVCCFTDCRQLPSVTDAIQAGGWIWRGLWVWDKTEAVRPFLGRFRSQCEYVVWGSRGGRPPRDDVGTLPGVCRAGVNAKGKFHTAGKPLEVMKELVRIVPSGGVVLDPFAGSGTTLLAAKVTGRDYIGCEINPEYHRIATERLAAPFAERAKSGDGGRLFARP